MSVAESVADLRSDSAFTFGSVCSGIEAASVAWESLGWRAAFFAEIDPFASAVLAYHWPHVRNFGDFTKIGREVHVGTAIDLLVGGTPCQAFSHAGQRQGLIDPRGNLTLEFMGLAQRLRPRWLVWENVPGVLSNDDGRTFGIVLGLLGHIGYGTAYRVLDAQYFGVAQRRRRVFVVGYRGAWQPAAAVLLEPSCMSGHSPPRREQRRDASDVAAFGADDRGDVARTLTTSAERFDVTSETLLAFNGRQDPVSLSDVSLPLDANGDGNATCLAYGIGTRMTRMTHARSVLFSPDVAYTMDTSAAQLAAHVVDDGRMVLRRLTPRECERLQGFPDDYTLVPYRRAMARDAPRYRALGNSFAVPVIRWIGKRIAIMDAALREHTS